MLFNTFRHIPGIGPATEERLWKAGITDWEIAKSPDPPDLSTRQTSLFRREIPLSLTALENRDPLYFSEKLPTALHWRLFPEFRDLAAYIDIETNGMDIFGGMITTIALYNGRDVFWYVNGRNLDAFVDDIQKYKLIVSYNGKSFDVPYIEQFFRIRLPHCHIDLRHVLAALGYKGGLKKCETALGIDRGFLQGIDGAFAPLLWYDYEINGNERALETLLAYNIEDVVNLEALLVTAYNLMISETPFKQDRLLPPPLRPAVPYIPDLLTIETIKRHIHTWDNHATTRYY